MIRLNVFIQVSADHRHAALEVAKKLVTASRQDAGCVAYDVFESATRPDVLMICETWQDAASLAFHEASPHFTALVPRLKELATLKLEQFPFAR